MSDRKLAGLSRRGFLGAVGVSAAAAGLEPASPSEIGWGGLVFPVETDAPPAEAGRGVGDGPGSPLFTPIPLQGNTALEELERMDLSQVLRDNAKFAPGGDCVCWGIPFQIGRVIVVRREPVEVKWPETAAPWLVFMHTTDMAPLAQDKSGFYPASKGSGLLRQHVADYVLLYADGSSERVSIRRQHQVGMIMRQWGANCFEAVVHQKPYPVRTTTEQPRAGAAWGNSQTRVAQPDSKRWVNWLWAWENPRAASRIVGLRIEPKAGALIVSGITAGRVSSNPLRWETRRKCTLRLRGGEAFAPNLSAEGLLEQVQLDLGQVISAQRRTLYPNDAWENSYNNKPPTLSNDELLVEFTAHPEARFHLPGGRLVPAGDPERGRENGISPVAASTRRVRLRILDKSSGKPVPVKLHVHGEAGEYLAPVDRHRIPNFYWYEDWSAEYVNQRAHFCTYIPGETTIDLPLGRAYVEISKGFDIRPIRRIADISPQTTELSFTLEKVLNWRQRGWVTADTHVHFLSPTTALLEGSGEGVNVVNLLASQWGELMTNVGDFDGRTTHGLAAHGGDGEYLVRVGTENRQHVLGHISLLGYNGSIIAPMTTAGPDESALGDPVDILLTEWARQCHKQGGVAILPHFPNPRAENAAAILNGEIDGVEMTSGSSLYGGINPYSLSDWYRYLNCGYFVAAVGGTDKMEAGTPVGAVRTYAKLPKGRIFDYEAWKEAVRSGHTFASYGPLLEFEVGGRAPGSRIRMNRSGGTVDVTWEVASVTVPMTRVELVVNGEIRESRAVLPEGESGHWSVRLERSSWLALLVRGHYEGRPEIITAHSSPVMVEVEGTPFFAAADALTILEQIEGALAYVDTIGTRAENSAYRRMRLVLTGTHREIHNRLHERGVFHDHTPATDHPEHRKTQG